MTERYSDDFDIPVLAAGESPLHGYRGEVDDESLVGIPAGVSIAISREAGARGATIARRAGEKLGWEVFSQDMLEYGAQSASLREEVLSKLPSKATEWVDEQLQTLLDQPNISRHPNLVDLARLVLALGAQGNVILLGRGAGFLLPSRSTLHVRLVAPLPDRITYMSQWLRLTEEEAAEQVRKRDNRRTDFLATHFHRKPNDVHLYDLIVNTSRFGEERSADLVVAAAKAKMLAILGME
ncbi:MAG: cytidylate kinase-like family protein [Planctomycetes bacterium]|nr:cytidylate kinase-like family protein [Planctomycetota bacterium]